MRFVVCDDDRIMRSIVESVITNQGHEIVGVAESTMPATDLIEHARADVVVLDLSLGFNTDFDMIQSAIAAGAAVIVFSANADADTLQRYEPRPMVVPKPDFAALDALIARLATEPLPDSAMGASGKPRGERRQRPGKAAVGPKPTGVHDAQAFYEAINQASEGDTLAFIDLVADLPADAVDAIADRVLVIIRDTDRMLASRSNVKVYLAGGGQPAVESFESRLGSTVSLPAGTEVRAVVVTGTETPNEAFDRLRRSDSAVLSGPTAVDL